MSGTTKAPVKKAAPRKAADKPLEVAPEQESVSPEVQMILDLEQQKLELATAQAQLNYLSGRVAELLKENHELRAAQG